MAEIRGLLERGALAAHPEAAPVPVREINLVAQDLASYGRDRGEAELEALLDGIAAIEGDFWLRLLYLHPDHFPFGVLPLLARDPRFLPYFDIPFQHASPRVLARMGRRGSAESHLELLARVREALPGAAFRSTFLLGFPGEEEEDFRRLLDFQQAARLDWVGAFAYSREEGTAAWRLPGRVRAAEARRRVRALQEAQQPHQRGPPVGAGGRDGGRAGGGGDAGGQRCPGRRRLGRRRRAHVPGAGLVPGARGGRPGRAARRGRGRRPAGRPGAGPPGAAQRAGPGGRPARRRGGPAPFAPMSAPEPTRPAPGPGAEPAWLEALNEAQRQAVLHFGKPLLILAGAGSGKTRVITTKIAWLVACRGLDPQSVLAVTFTNKAADEMRGRVAALVPEADGVMVRTFHSFGAWLLRRGGHRLGLPRHFSIYDNDDARSALKGVLGEGAAAERVEEVARWIERAKERALGPEDELDSISLDGTFPAIYRGYQQRLLASGAADFGDLILQSVRLLAGHPEVRERLRQRFRVILVDEFQDSNGAQLELLRQLHDGSGYLCVVGDEDQSIYGFRGAELRNILDFPKLFPGTEIIRLEENYRSTQNILKAASGVVAHNLQRLGKTLFTRQGSGEPVRLVFLEDQDREAEFCADLLRDGAYGGTAILYRMNFQSRVFENLFTRLGIPYRVVGTLRFYEREEIKDALAWLVLLLNPRDEVAFRRAAAKPRRGIGEKTLERVAERARRTGEDLIAAGRGELPSLPSRSARGLAELLRLQESLAAALGGPAREEAAPAGGGQEGGAAGGGAPATLAAVVGRLIVDSGLYQAYGARDQAEGRGGSDPRVKNLEELVNGTLDYPPGREGLVRFLENVELGALGESGYQPAERVTLITVHNTKGLEFDRVIITGMEEGTFPITAGGEWDGEGRDVEEERRLFYVGVTRARRELYLTSCRRRRVFGRTVPRDPSRFLDEVPEETLEVQGRQAGEEAVDRFPLGCGVYHEDFGAGVVTRKWLEGGEPMVIVRFESGRSGRFFLRYTPLERIGSED